MYQCTVNEIFSDWSTGHEKIIKQHKVIAETPENMCKKVYKYVRGSRYDNRRRFEIAEPALKQVYDDWVNSGGITMDLFYGGFVYD